MQPVEHPGHKLPVFVWCTGQDDNIGDVVLRRRLLDELRPFGTLHIFLADASVEFVQALSLAIDDVVYEDHERWKATLNEAARRGPVLSIGKPGELQIDRIALRRALRRLLMHRRVVRNGGLVLQLGIGARSQPRSWMSLFRLAFRYHQQVLWRDPQSQAHFGFGAVMPDWGFGDLGPKRPAAPLEATGPRDLVAISMRGDRPIPGRPWLDGVKAFCQESGLSPVVVTQVRRDGERSRVLAHELGSYLVDWNDQTHVAQELRLRDIYARSALTISDRLHVLIVGFTEGSVPLCMLDRAEHKVGRHFDAAGYPGASIDVSGQAAGEIARHLHAAHARAAEVAAARLKVLERIGEVGRDLRRLVAARLAA
ncbi:hypothetical protein [Geminicoccus roseus]|uniref:hypothetical protein n=1 Tax=Geminicoccus roseus TaxID=404900 RepID=UPI0004110947|nr:hypothetical protein [Geminicoccus roseus]